MHAPLWLPLTLNRATVDAKPPALWTRVHDYVKGPVRLKITATGTWNIAPAAACGPQGDIQLGLAAGGLNDQALKGALIGKIGGSASDKPATAGFAFVVGEFAVIVVPETTEGALYLTMNDDVGAFGQHSGAVDVTILAAR
jgi:hypothetical protein